MIRMMTLQMAPAPPVMRHRVPESRNFQVAGTVVGLKSAKRLEVGFEYGG